MSTVHDRIAEADRQIERMKLRVQRQAVHTETLELAELTLLQQHRLDLYREATFADVPKKAS